MINTQNRIIFVNLVITDLGTTVDFFTELGFSFNGPERGPGRAACGILSRAGG